MDRLKNEMVEPACWELCFQRFGVLRCMVCKRTRPCLILPLWPRCIASILSQLPCAGPTLGQETLQRGVRRVCRRAWYIYSCLDSPMRDSSNALSTQQSATAREAVMPIRIFLLSPTYSEFPCSTPGKEIFAKSFCRSVGRDEKSEVLNRKRV